MAPGTAIFTIAVWALGAAAIIWATRPNKSVEDAAKSAPPPLPERGPKQEVQVNVVRDTSHPNRWIVTRPSGWMTQEIEKEAGTT